MGNLVNQAELGRGVALPQPTVGRYLNLLETSYLLVRLPAYAVNRTKRLIKSPKLYWGDTGVALHLTQEEEPRGAHLENLVLHDLLAWRDARLDRAEVLYWRTAIGEEVDFVIEAGDRLLPIEVKATERPRLRDIAHLRTFRAEYGDRAREQACCSTLAIPWNGWHRMCLLRPGGGCYEASSGGDGSKVIRVLDIGSHRGPPGWRQVY